MDTTRIEAELMSLTGYTTEASSISSGGKVVNTSNVGVAATRFSGTPGIYKVVVAAHDENDGVSQMTLKVDGREVYSWTLNDSSDSSIATSGNLARRIIPDIRINQNSLIEVVGRQNQNEFARLDYVEFEPTDLSNPAPTNSDNNSDNNDSDNNLASTNSDNNSDNNDSDNTPAPTNSDNNSDNNDSDNANDGAGIAAGNPNSTIRVGERVEAESMSLLGYIQERSSISSGSEVIRVSDGGGTASTKFEGSAGNYDIAIVYYDENDGRSEVVLTVDGKRIDGWAFGESTDSDTVSPGNKRTHVLSGVALNNNSVIRIQGAKHQNEFARVDYVKVTASGGGAAPGASTVGLGRIEAESMALSGYTVEKSGISAGGYVINTADSGTARTTFSGNAGKYDLAVAYYDENDGQSPISVRVDGNVVDSWTFDEATNSTIAETTNLRKRVISGVRLNANSVIEIQGAKNDNEFARIDYLEIAQEGGIGGVPKVGGGDKLRVLALGDSNTKGEGTPGGYRIKFWDRAVRDGIGIDFLGDRSNGPSSLGDKDHQGQGGWAIPQMTAWVNSGNLARQNPDIIMFMMGTNDANTNGNVSATAIRDRLSGLIDAVAKATPNAHLFVSSIIPLNAPRGTSTEAQVARDFNALIPALVNSKAGEGKRVSFVNAGGSLGSGDVNGAGRPGAQNDGLHATSSGYDKLGNAWYDGVSRSNVWQGLVAAQRGSGSAERDADTTSLIGDSEDNFLFGGSGFDELTGSGGSDTFTYIKPSDGLDRITDFDGNDTIRVLKSGFGGDLVVDSSLSSDDYVLGNDPSAQNGGSTFLFNTRNQTLSFDVDGTGSAAAVEIATFSNGFAPQATQIDVVA